MALTSKLYDVADMLIKEGYFDDTYKKDPADIRIIKGVTTSEGVTTRLEYFQRMSIGFSKNEGPFTLKLERDYPISRYLELLSLHAKTKTGRVKGGYSAEGNLGLIGRIERILKQRSLTTRTEAMLEELLKTITPLSDSFVSYGFEFEGRTEDLKELVVDLMGLKPRNR